MFLPARESNDPVAAGNLSTERQLQMCSSQTIQKHYSAKEHARMSYMALYRKFRPQTFEQVKGQDHVVRTLKNQIKNNRIGHAYLFTGTRGTGKTSVAKLFARAINCQSPVDGNPCNHCEACLAAARDSFMDIVEVDAASNTSVDDIRRIIDEIQYTPVNGRYKVYIIDEAHMLSGSAFNAFLKTLEEPPSYAVFILATTEPHKLPITILSRCQRYDFHRISNETIAANLADLVAKEGVEAEDKALSYIARMGDGSMRDSISLLDKCIAFNLGDRLTYENVLTTLGVVDTEVFSRVFRAVYAGNAAGALRELESAVNEGKDISQFVSDFVWYLRNLLIVNVSGSAGDDLLGISEENLQTLREDAQIADAGTLMRYIRIQSELLNSIRYSPVKQILVEVSFIKLAKPQMEQDGEAIADRLRQLEQRAPAVVMSGAAPVRAEAPAPNVSSVRKEEKASAPQVWEMKPDDLEDAPQQTPPRIPEPAKAPAQMQISAGGTIDSSGSICASWADIVDACTGMRLKVALRKAHPGEEEDSTVSIFSPGGVGLDTIKAELKDVEQAILKVTGKAVTAVVKKEGEMRSAAFPEDLLKNIHFEIGTEEV